MGRREDTVCTRKVKHDSQQAALVAMWSRCAESPRRWVGPYRCEYCDQWHWGGVPDRVLKTFDATRAEIIECKDPVQLTRIAKKRKAMLERWRQQGGVQRSMAIELQNLGRYQRLILLNPLQ